MKLIVLLLFWLCAGVVNAAMLEGVGHANIRENNLDQARAEARQAAMRDLALQYEASISTEDTLENGKLTQSQTRLSARAQLRNATIIDEYRSGNLLRVIVRAELAGAADRASCKAGDASGLRKRVAVTGFPITMPAQGGSQALDDAGEKLPQALVARLQAQGRMQVLGATSLQLFGNLADAPTSQKNLTANHLTNVVQLARELGAQFVVSGVIRDIGLSDPNAWGSSITNRMQRRAGLVDTTRRFEAEVMVFDGFSGSPVFQQRFATSAHWDPKGSGSGGFASAGFEKSEWGQAVTGVIDDMTAAVNNALACQPFMARVTRVEGDRVTLASGATAGLQPGDELNIYRSQRYFDSLDGTPELTDAGVSITLDNVHPDFSTGRLPMTGGQVNLQRDDIAIIW
ncbi:flagellar assembly protein T N-terminal domain-containing protein [Marinobacter sp.]|uniref:flagellar assembly protein T N-terminal domain-containing protein n=1 Tax=Marinobacter sp. TaxID=50741 RepID=UPI0019FA7BF0|nr:flagellar assembly protein T N-terminal domain-containing protein [Marinobacter sp.]MBE0486205.1 flagella assembly protein FlgT [Marinobacter sp.]